MRVPLLPRASRRAAGYTLVEILAALAILLVGLSAVLAVLFGTMRESSVSSDRNVASLLLPEAIREIERRHFISDNADANYGLYIETLTNASTTDDSAPYGNVSVGDPAVNLQEAGSLNTWPHMSEAAARVGNAPYRVRYRLERHQAWHPHSLDGTYLPADEKINSEFRGIYVLTLMVFRDPKNDVASLVPITEPVVVYLGDRGVRTP